MTLENDIQVIETPSAPAAPAEGATQTKLEGEGQEGDGQKPKRDNFQRAINRQTRKYYEEKARADVLERELEKVRGGQGGQKPAAAAPDPDAEPNPDDFQDPKEYTKAVARHAARQTVKEESQRSESHRAASNSQEVERAFTDREDAYREESETYDDAVDTLRDAKVKFAPAAIEYVMDSERGPALLQHLGDNLKLAKEIAALPPLKAVAALARLEDKLLGAKPEEKKKSGAPEPVKPLKGRAGIEADPEKLSDEEWIRNRRAELKKKK